MSNTKTKIEQTPAKSIVNYMWVQMRENGDETLKAKKNTCVSILKEAIDNRYIHQHTGEYMQKKINSMRSHDDLQRYLVNSKHYFETHFVMQSK